MRTTEDALRSVKKYLAVVLGRPPTPLAAARWLRAPSADVLAQAAVAGAYGVWTGLDDLDVPAEALLADRDASDGLVRVPILRGGQRWFVTPPLTRREAGGDLVAAAASEDLWSPGLVAGAAEVTGGPGGDPQWELLLGQPRFAFDLYFEAGGRAYRARPLDADPRPAAAAAGFPLGIVLVAEDALPAAAQWDVRFFHDRGEFVAPLAVVKAAGPTTPTTSVSHWSDLTQPITLYLYPPAPPEGADYGAVQLGAERLRNLVVAAFDVSADTPMRIPLYDYDGVAGDQAASQRGSSDYLRVVDFSAEVTSEPGDPAQVVVVADMRVSWSVAEERRGTRPVGDVRVGLELS